jgi:hypothetical protein
MDSEDLHLFTHDDVLVLPIFRQRPAIRRKSHARMKEKGREHFA